MVHLHTIENGHRTDEVETTAKVDAAYFVVERDGAQWSPAAKIWHVFPQEPQAEAAAKSMKEIYPQRHFGVAVLRSEARHVRKPVEIVRVVPSPDDAADRPHA